MSEVPRGGVWRRGTTATWVNHGTERGKARNVFCKTRVPATHRALRLQRIAPQCRPGGLLSHTRTHIPDRRDGGGGLRSSAQADHHGGGPHLGFIQFIYISCSWRPCAVCCCWVRMLRSSATRSRRSVSIHRAQSFLHPRSLVGVMAWVRGFSVVATARKLCEGQNTTSRLHRPFSYMCIPAVTQRWD